LDGAFVLADEALSSIFNGSPHGTILRLNLQARRFGANATTARSWWVIRRLRYFIAGWNLLIQIKFSPEPAGMPDID
jgi:hypothetical protein